MRAPFLAYKYLYFNVSLQIVSKCKALLGGSSHAVGDVVAQTTITASTRLEAGRWPRRAWLRLGSRAFLRPGAPWGWRALGSPRLVCSPRLGACGSGAKSFKSQSITEVLGITFSRRPDSSPRLGAAPSLPHSLCLANGRSTSLRLVI